MKRRTIVDGMNTTLFVPGLAAAHAAVAATISTSNGAARGVERDGVTWGKNIRYGESTAGTGRFRPLVAFPALTIRRRRCPRGGGVLRRRLEPRFRT
ncbi:hypothetical protein NHF48_000050 [Sphingomonas sp. H160509]|uniref:hypothetical protein n=1 Tax=Sphingomonas sp. H160509 TaxID=2955313 RepID=UPI0020981A5B|nr:hypothetical protein [Sphingomonas sp. H160509]MDD1449665.1 hypothetical protein [Sphingomonas sp. H160509]